MRVALGFIVLAAIAMSQPASAQSPGTATGQQPVPGPDVTKSAKGGEAKADAQPRMRDPSSPAGKPAPTGDSPASGPTAGVDPTTQQGMYPKTGQGQGTPPPR